MNNTVTGWRIAWFHPLNGCWRLSAYVYRDLGAAMEVESFLPLWLGDGVKARVIECQDARRYER